MNNEKTYCLVSNTEIPSFVRIEEHYYVHLDDGSSIEVSSDVCSSLCRSRVHDCNSSFKLMCEEFGRLFYLVTYFFTFDDLSKETVEFYIKDHVEK